MVQRMFGRVALATGVVSAIFVSVACSSSDGGGTGSDVGAACDAYFDKVVSGQYSCLGVTFPADVTASQRARFRTECIAGLGYPGQGITAATLSACASVYGSASCRGSTGAGAACGAVTGSLADGAACNSASQCKSGFCNQSASGADGGAAPSGCGVCAPSVAVGQSCATGTCTVGAECVGGTCIATGSVAVGGACNSAVDCQTGLTCSAQKCAALSASGGACSTSAGCQTGLVCDKNVCGTPIAIGGDCSATSPSCATGAVCDYAGTKKCLAIAFAKPGAPCGLTSSGYALCAVGSCNSAGGAAGTCPDIIADGQACDGTDKTKTCDSLARCSGGVCVLGQSVCK